MKTQFKKIAYLGATSFFIYFLIFFSQASLVSASATVCANLSADLSYGAVDSYSGGPVMILQNFLLTQGYMTATPNGHFGPATLSAVIAFQSAKKISPTGFVGPLTRAAISSASCVAVPVSTPAISTPTQNTQPVQQTSSSAITAPASGSTLSIGQTYIIKWNAQGNSGYSIVLEDQNGLSQGFITPNSQLSGSYSWQVGSVLSGITNSYSNVAPGTYRIHLYSAGSGAPDIYSGIFNIIAPPLVINSVMPTTVSLSNGGTVAIYGSGLNSSAKVNIDGSYNLSANTLYTSPDGTIIVFSLPAGLSTGTHIAEVSNAYGSLMPSPSFIVTQ